MRVSNIVQVTIMLSPSAVLPMKSLPGRFVGLFTRVPTRSQLGDAFEHKADLAAHGLGITPLDFEPLRAFIRKLPRGPIESCHYQKGMIAVDENEPLYLP